jgi:hypothetical protein
MDVPEKPQCFADRRWRDAFISIIMDDAWQSGYEPGMADEALAPDFELWGRKIVAIAQDLTHGTVGWFASATGTIGITKGQTVRVSIVNVGAVDSVICYGLWQNPTPIALIQDSFTLRPGYGKGLDLKASDCPSSDNLRQMAA